MRFCFFGGRILSKTIKNAVIFLFIIVFLGFAGTMMNRAAKKLEHWAYPIKYEEIISEKAKEYDVPPSVVYAVIRQESNFDPEAESRVGARGLMQVMKTTYEWIDYYRGASGAEWEDLYSPEANADYGIWLLSYLYEEFGDWETVYAAYNAGMNIVKTWLKNPEYSADGQTLYKIPYLETEKYVEKVSSYRKGYMAVYDID